MSRPKKELTSLTKEKKRAASGVGMSEVHFMGQTREACKWLQVPWIENKEIQDSFNTPIEKT